jgi:hypothetical protein
MQKRGVTDMRVTTVLPGQDFENCRQAGQHKPWWQTWRSLVVICALAMGYGLFYFLTKGTDERFRIAAARTTVSTL